MTVWRAGLARRRRREGGGASFTTITDSFNRANSALTLGSTDTGQAWTADLGTWGIDTNRAYVASSGGQNIVTVESGVADCTITATFVLVPDGQRIVFRAVDASNYLFLNVEGTGTVLHLYSYIAASFGHIASASYSWSAGDVVSVVLSGQNIIANVNGAEIISTTSALLQTATKHGLGADNTTARWDAFSITVP